MCSEDANGPGRAPPPSRAIRRRAGRAPGLRPTHARLTSALRRVVPAVEDRGNVLSGHAMQGQVDLGRAPTAGRDAASGGAARVTGGVWRAAHEHCPLRAGPAQPSGKIQDTASALSAFSQVSHRPWNQTRPVGPHLTRCVGGSPACVTCWRGWGVHGRRAARAGRGDPGRLKADRAKQKRLGRRRPPGPERTADGGIRGRSAWVCATGLTRT